MPPVGEQTSPNDASYGGRSPTVVVGNPALYRLVRGLAHRGLPAYFVLFILVYFTTGSVLKNLAG